MGGVARIDLTSILLRKTDIASVWTGATSAAHDSNVLVALIF